MVESKIITRNGNPILLIDNKEFSPCAYITYFDERNDYELFAKKGFKIYTVTISLAKQPINTLSGFTPFYSGIFDKKGQLDFAETDKSINKILKVCPDAYIFPRINVTMPDWWVEENPTETIDVPVGGRREILSSQKFRDDASKMLREVIEYFKVAPYSKRIFGYQICGGNTQEWAHYDINGSYCDNILPYFNAYLKHKGLPQVTELPDIKEIDNSVFIDNKTLQEFIKFTNDEMAETVDALCKTVKEAVNYKQIVGTFYGYNAEVMNPLWGTHSLWKTIDSENIDFYSSPNSYISRRSLGVDWGDMMPVDSVRLHGKMTFMECDVRTFLTRAPGESRKGSDPMGYYTDELWIGPKTEELSVSAIRKSLARQLTHKHGLWWFDMFGHWYSTDKMMKEMKTSLDIYNRLVNYAPLEYPTEIAVFTDETAYSVTGKLHPDYECAYYFRTSLGECGAPYHSYLLSDFDKINWENATYKTVIFNTPLRNNDLAEILRAKGIVCIDRANPDKEMLINTLKESGVFLYTEGTDVFYIGNGYLAIHSKSEGVKKITLPEEIKCTDTATGEVVITDMLKLNMKQFETRLFEINKDI